MIFEWDEAKNRRNIALRGLDFADAKLVFANLVRLKIDNRRDYGERRFIALARVEVEALICIYTKRPPARRIISLRRANRRERNAHR